MPRYALALRCLTPKTVPDPKNASQKTRQLVTRSMSDSLRSRIASMPSVTAVVACWATSFATRVTRVIGDELVLRLAAGRFADFFALDFFALDFLIAGPRRADFLAPPFRAELLRALVVERFAPPRLAARLEDFFAPPFLPPRDFDRDFLARVAISLTPVVGRRWEQPAGTIANTGSAGKGSAVAKPAHES